MAWLSQNWIWIVVAIGFFYFMTRMHGGGHSMGRSMGYRDGGRNEAPPSDRGTASDIAVDPVSRRAVATAGAAISAVYHGRAYYFESREDRDAFEKEPEKYLATLPASGQALGSEGNYEDRPRRRRGGC